jgi:hypothetical protein
MITRYVCILILCLYLGNHIFINIVDKSIWDFDNEQIIAAVPPHWKDGILEEVCICICIYIYVYIWCVYVVCIHMYFCMHVFMYVCVYVYMHVYILVMHVYICMYR